VAQRAARLIGAEAKLNDQKVREMQVRHWRISWERAREELGYVPPYDVEQAVGETLEWYRVHRWL
jgi:nucleoside-diphosphate-sugar epimerase